MKVKNIINIKDKKNTSFYLLSLIHNQLFSSINPFIHPNPILPAYKTSNSKDTNNKEIKYNWEEKRKVPTLFENKITNPILSLFAHRANNVGKDYKRIHEYHLVENSPWPILISISLLSIILSIVLIFNNINIYNEYKYKILIFISLFGFFICLFNWLNEIHIEGTLEGNHTERVQKGLTTGFILFVVSEICIFITLFFAFFYNSLIPSIEISSIYPPIGIESINPKTLPLLNTIILFISGITSTCSLNFLITTKIPTLLDQRSSKESNKEKKIKI